MIFDKILCLATLSASMGLLNVDIREPSRAQDVTGFTLYNGTDYELEFENGYTSEFYVVPAKSTLTIDTRYNQPNDWYVYGEFEWDNINESFWYETLDSIGIPTYPEWEYTGSGSQFNVKGLISVAHGIGVYTEQYYSNDTDFYIDPNKWGGIGKGINSYNGTFRVSPQNATTIRIYKEGGTYTTATAIYAARMSYDESFNFATMVYAVVNGQYINLANNFGYKGNVVQGGVGPTDPKAIQPYLTYYNGYTNRVRLINCELTKDAESDPYTGYMPYGYPYLSDVEIGYVAIGPDSESNTEYALTAGFTFAYMAFTAIAPLFGFVVFPGITIGMLICIPLIISITFAVIKIIKKGG